ncbi:MAG TPA: PAC2 family protein [Dehalococcoidia bacterium]|nr:PAC2 family protein [Dehalococcoidia bacterium]
MNTLPAYEIYTAPELSESSLLVCWDMDAGKVGPKVFSYLNSCLDLELFAEIDSCDYFTLGGVLVENDVARFPQIKMYHARNSEVVILRSATPRFEWYKYLSTVFEIAEKICKVREVYTIGGIVSVSAHTVPRILMANLNSGEIREKLSGFDVAMNMDYETPPGQRPTMSSYLSWEAGRRNIPAVSLWVPVPFYMVGIEDLRGCTRVLEFLEARFQLGLNIANLDTDISRQNHKINSIIEHYPDLLDTIRKLESNNALTDAESGRLLEIMGEELKIPGY